MTKKYSKRSWWLKLSVVLVLPFMVCGLANQSVYAEEAGQEVVSQQDPASNTAVSTDSKIAATEHKKVLPTTLTLTLQDGEGKPIVGVAVSAMEGALAGQERAHARTDKNGKAVFKHLKSGTYYFFADIKELRKHAGYDFPAIIKEIKSPRSYYISESKQFDLSQNVEYTDTIKRYACVMVETFLDVFKPNKIVVVNKKMGIGQNISVKSDDFIQIYMPMRSVYQIITVKDGDFDSWIIDFYAHEGLRIELL